MKTLLVLHGLTLLVSVASFGEQKDGREDKDKEACPESGVLDWNSWDDELAKKYLDQKDKPVKDPSELDCNFKDFCCWNNIAVHHFASSRQLTVEALCVPGSEPDGPFGILFNTANSNEANTFALFASCPLECADSVTVEVDNWWVGSDLELSACTISNEDAVHTVKDHVDRPKDAQCKPFPKGENKVTGIPGGKNIRVGIMVEKMTARYDAVIIDNIKVTTVTEQCEKDKQDAADAAALAKAKEICPKASCTMDGKICKWKSPATDLDWKGHSKQEITGNSDTGVNAPNQFTNQVPDVGYAGVPLNPKSAKAMSANVATVSENLVMHLKVYEACVDNLVQVCADKKCRGVSKKGVKIGDRKWKPVKVPVPKGTKKLTITARNTGAYYCAAGVRDVNFSRQSDKSGKPICDPQ